MSGRSKLVLFGSIVLLATLIPPLAYMVFVPQDIPGRILLFIVVVPCAGLWGLGAPFIWKETEWWYRLQLKRWGRAFNRAIQGGLEVVGPVMIIGAPTVLFGDFPGWSSPLVWLGIPALLLGRILPALEQILPGSV